MVRLWLCSILTLVLSSSSSWSQETWTVRAYGGLGIGVASLTSLADYANVLGGPAGKRVEDFQSLFDLNGGVEINIADGWTVGLDYVFASRTIETNPDVPGAGWTFEPSLGMPTIVVRRMYVSPSMAYGFGGGVGYHSGRLNAIPPGLVVGTDYTGSGIGILAEAVAYTYFDESLGGMVAVDVRWSSVSRLTDGAGNTPRTGNGIEASLNTFSLALRFGISYQI